MPIQLALALSAGLLIATDTDRNDPAKEEMRKFEGNWKELSRVESDGEHTVRRRIKGAMWTFWGEMCFQPDEPGEGDVYY